MSVIVFELTIKALRVNYFPRDVDIWQALEKDPIVRARLEAAAGGLEPDHDQEQGPVSVFTDAQFGEKDKQKDATVDNDTEAQIKAERDIQDLLNKPRVMNTNGQISPLTPMSPLSPIVTGSEFEGYDYQRGRGGGS